MIKVKDAKDLIYVGTHELHNIESDLRNSSGFALSSNIYSPVDFPDFDQSAMDGYGIFFEKEINDSYKIIGEEQAGNTETINYVKKGEAVRIFTGSKIPEGVNTVVQQEWVQREGNELHIRDFPVQKGMNIRLRGSQTQKGEMVLEKGCSLTPGAVSLLAGLGIDKIEVISKPRITILNTGKELVPPGNPIQSGQVYESNSYALHQALVEMDIPPLEIVWVDDELGKLIEMISHALASSDLVLITGGVSVGDYDFVVAALEANGVHQIFHKVKQKPGKPLYFGKKENKHVFGLPGNPASVLTCFYQFVIPCIKIMMGFSEKELMQTRIPCLNHFEKKAGLTQFLKGKLTEHGVRILPHQESYKMNTYAVADVLIEIEEETTRVQVNDLVKVYFLVI